MEERAFRWFMLNNTEECFNFLYNCSLKRFSF